jgi:hypothetical protein
MSSVLLSASQRRTSAANGVRFDDSVAKNGRGGHSGNLEAISGADRMPYTPPKRTVSVELTDEELIAIERALCHSSANTIAQRDLLGVFLTADIRGAARSGFRKVGKGSTRHPNRTGSRGLGRERRPLSAGRGTTLGPLFVFPYVAHSARP